MWNICCIVKCKTKIDATVMGDWLLDFIHPLNKELINVHYIYWEAIFSFFLVLNRNGCR